ncbi:hypothetical protein H920_03561 [Fukomys damarensis]|uniref:Uncharacterized protein n=1 Tax=Fukomys damarensis TaxID=885580 RepID=A0A091DSB8_FUKDA|nr:hypothetical protein H920_03561 [Fukomys damarensis]
MRAAAGEKAEDTLPRAPFQEAAWPPAPPVPVRDVDRRAPGLQSPQRSRRGCGSPATAAAALSYTVVRGSGASTIHQPYVSRNWTPVFHVLFAPLSTLTLCRAQLPSLPRALGSVATTLEDVGVAQAVWAAGSLLNPVAVNRVLNPSWGSLVEIISSLILAQEGLLGTLSGHS